MDIRRREAELFLLRYDGEETEAIGHLRYVNQKLDACEKREDAIDSDRKQLRDDMRELQWDRDDARDRHKAAELKLVAVKEAAEAFLATATDEALAKFKELVK